MKSMITQQEEKNYYKRTNLLLPIFTGLIFSLIIYIIYRLVLVIVDGNEMNWNYIYLAFALGFLEGLSTIYFTFKVNQKKFRYFSNYNKKTKQDIYVPVILKKGFLQDTKGVLLITKDTIEYKIYQMFEKKSLFFTPNKNVEISMKREENNWFKKIITLSSFTTKLYLNTEDKEYKFVIPCLDNIEHRLTTHKVNTIS